MANLSQTLSHIDSQLSLFLSSSNFSLSSIPSPESTSLLRSWYPSIQALPYTSWNATISSNDDLASIPSGLYRLTFAVMDQLESEYMYGYYIQDGALKNLRYGVTPHAEIQPLEDLLFERVEVKPAPVPGDDAVMMPRVYLYDTLGKTIKLNSVVSLVGVYVNSEFHAIEKVEEEDKDVGYEVREDVYDCLKNTLGGDEVAAKCVMIELMSKVLDRNSLIGKFSLNLIGLSDCKPVTEYIKKLTSVKELNITLGMLDGKSFISKKDCDTGIMEISPLQMPNSTILMISEYTLQPGNLHETGLRNLEILSNFISRQTLAYDFGVYSLDFEVDNPVIILSEGKSLFPSDLQLHLHQIHPPQPSEPNPSHALYLKSARKIQCSIPDTIAKLAESVFVERRRGEGMEPEELHRVILFARYLSMSYGLSEVTSSAWTEALNLHDSLKMLENTI